MILKYDCLVPYFKGRLLIVFVANSDTNILKFLFPNNTYWAGNEIQMDDTVQDGSH